MIVILFGQALIFDENLNVLKLLERSISECIVFFTACALLFMMGFMFVFQITMMLNNKTTFELNLSATKTPFK